MNNRTKFWGDICAKYPDSYVLFKDYVMDGGDLVSGDIVLVTKNSSELREKCDELRNNGIEFLWDGTNDVDVPLFFA